MENKRSIIDTILQLSRVSRRSHGGHRHTVSPGAFRVLKILSNNESMKASDLAEALDIRPASLTEKLTRMEQHELINRERDSNDSRIVLVSLSNRGKELLEKRRKNNEEMTNKLENVLTEAEQIEFARISEKLISFFEAENPRHHERGNN